MNLYQAVSGDTDVDGDVDGDDVQNILAANTFPRRASADWSTGDFTDDGLCDGDDIQAILAEGWFGQGPYCATKAADGLAAATAVLVVPEPTAVSMLAIAGIFGLLASTLRSRRKPGM